MFSKGWARRDPRMKRLMAGVWRGWQSELKGQWIDGKKNVITQLCLREWFLPHILHTDLWPLERMCTSTMFPCRGDFRCYSEPPSKFGVWPGCPCSSVWWNVLSTEMLSGVYLMFSLLTEGIQLPGCYASHQRNLMTTRENSLGARSCYPWLVRCWFSLLFGCCTVWLVSQASMTEYWSQGAYSTIISCVVCLSKYPRSICYPPVTHSVALLSIPMVDGALSCPVQGILTRQSDGQLDEIWNHHE